MHYTIYSEPVRWCKSKCPNGNQCDGGSRYTYVKRVYALAVSVALNGRATCAICDYEPVSLESGEVDRTISGCYRPGYVAMTCHRCNNERTGMAGFDSDEYAYRVYEASAGIIPLGVTDAKALWDAAKPERGETVRKSRFFKG